MDATTAFLEERGYKLLEGVPGEDCENSDYRSVRVAERLGSKGSKQQVALTVLEKTGADDNALAQIQREVDVAMTLKKIHTHPHVEEIYDVQQRGDHVFILRSRGPEVDSILDCVRRKGGLSEYDSREIFLQLCFGLDHFHFNYMFHGNLKADSVFVDKNNNLVVTDLRWSGNAASYPKNDVSKRRLVAPEVSSGQPYSGIKADIWNLGIVLYVLTQGYVPEESDVRDIRLSSSASNELVDLAGQLLSPDATKRPTMPQILLHPWMKSRSKTHPLNTPVVVPPRRRDTLTHSRPVSFQESPISEKISESIMKKEKGELPVVPQTFTSERPETPPSSQETIERPETPPARQETTERPETPPSSQETIERPETPPARQETTERPETPPARQETTERPETPPARQETTERPETPPARQETTERPETPPARQETTERPETPPTDPETTERPETPPVIQERTGRPETPPVDQERTERPETPKVDQVATERPETPPVVQETIERPETPPVDQETTERPETPPVVQETIERLETPAVVQETPERPETPPADKERPETPPADKERPETPPADKERPETPPVSQETVERPETPPVRDDPVAVSRQTDDVELFEQSLSSLSVQADDSPDRDVPRHEAGTASTDAPPSGLSGTEASVSPPVGNYENHSDKAEDAGISGEMVQGKPEKKVTDI